MGKVQEGHQLCLFVVEDRGLGLFCKATFTVMPEEELMKTEVREAWLGEDEGHVPSREKREGGWGWSARRLRGRWLWLPDSIQTLWGNLDSILRAGRR